MVIDIIQHRLTPLTNQRYECLNGIPRPYQGGNRPTPLTNQNQNQRGVFAGVFPLRNLAYQDLGEAIQHNLETAPAVWGEQDDRHGM